MGHFTYFNRMIPDEWWRNFEPKLNRWVLSEFWSHLLCFYSFKSNKKFIKEIIDSYERREIWKIKFKEWKWCVFSLFIPRDRERMCPKVRVFPVEVWQVFVFQNWTSCWHFSSLSCFVDCDFGFPHFLPLSSDLPTLVIFICLCELSKENGGELLTKSFL